MGTTAWEFLRGAPDTSADYDSDDEAEAEAVAAGSGASDKRALPWQPFPGLVAQIDRAPGQPVEHADVQDVPGTGPSGVAFDGLPLLVGSKGVFLKASFNI